LPEGSLLLALPGRSVMGWTGGSVDAIECVDGEQINAVAAALPLGFTRVALPAYAQRPDAPVLPLYGYSAVAWGNGGFCVAAVRTDELESWSPASHSADSVREGVALRTLEFPRNALVVQLSRCATEYGCFTAQNVFLRQGEAALPVSPACNARCLGCISEQDPDSPVRSAQERVRTRPTEEEICEVAIAHLRAVPQAIVSFGQGCEGEPLLAVDLIERSIRRIRQATNAGVVHCNTNASRPAALERLIDAGLRSVRVSLNSARPEVYAAYYRPRGYDFDDVVASLQAAASRGVTISLNLLTHPGVTDDPREAAALASLLRDVPVSMLQTRTLNVDPAVYFAAVGRPKRAPLGMRRWLEDVHREFPALQLGNFTRGFG
jgi:pyruvate-formate lyase-activating enzyme